MKTDVLWINLDPDALARGMWDQGLLERIFAGKVWRLRRTYEHHVIRDELDIPPDVGGAIVVLPGRFHVDRIDRLNVLLGRLEWVVLIVTSDEESLFPIELLRHPRMKLWVMTPDPSRQYDPGVRFLGEYFAADTSEILWAADMDTRKFDVGFWGQITHPRRERMWEAIEGLDHSRLFVAASATEGFTLGLPRDEYLRSMANTKIAPAPAGPATADSFRLFEALEAGCFPIADSRADGKPEGYWDLLLLGHEPRPFPVIDDWSTLAQYVDHLLPEWKSWANSAQAWWQRYKRELVVRLEADVDEISDRIPGRTIADLVTVIMPTSPIPSHPSISMICETIDSIQDRLPGCEIVVVADGVRGEQEGRRADYEEFIRRFLWETNFARADVIPVVMAEHGHQANATRRALEWVRSPLVLFVEHDTPLVGDIPFDDLAAVIMAGEANLIRLHHEASVLEPHQHLMLDTEPRDVMGAPLLGTIQWSQRPHLASTSFYRQIIRRYFGHESRTMIEDVMHGVVQAAARENGWGMFRLFMYAPDGDIKRSTHLDGRGDDPKFDDRFVIEYDGDQPDWAPLATSARPVHKQPGTPDLDVSDDAPES